MFYLQPDPANRWFCFVMLRPKYERKAYRVSASLYFKQARAALQEFRAAYAVIQAQRASVGRKAVQV